MSSAQAPQPLSDEPPERRSAIKRFLVTGLLAMTPLLVTVYVLAWGFGFIDKTLGLGIQKVMGATVGAIEFGTPAAAFLQELLTHRVFADFVALLIVIGVLLAVGFALGTFIGRQIFRALENRVARLPMVRLIYPMVKEVMQLFSAEKKQFGQVVVVEYPRKGVYSLGFMTSRGTEAIRAPDGRRMVCVFVPTSPSPVTGYVIFVPEDEVLPVNLSVDAAMKIIISAGIVVPNEGKAVDASEAPPAALAPGSPARPG